MKDELFSDIILRAVSEIIRKGMLPDDLPDELMNHPQFSKIIAELTEVQRFALAVSSGDLEQSLRSRGVMAGALKSLQANLRHLSWQTQQIAKGDLTQRVDFMGEFSDAFNSMVAALADARTELWKAKEAAEAAARAKSEFLSNMSHELRTPLNAILGFAQLMGRGQNLDSEQRENLGIIIRSGDHLLTLINNVLDLSKIEAGRMTLNEQNFDLHGMLDDLEDMFRLKAEENQLQLIFDRSSVVPKFVRTDPVRLRQVLINLLNNAFKFTKEGGVALRVQSSKCKMQNDNFALYTLHFELEDTGAGMSPDELSTLFEAFVQTQTGRTSQEGTGLGLAISRQFVQMMGGDMSVSSKKDKGSIFRFDVRIKPAASADDKTKPSVRRVIGLESGQPQYRILIVDDKWDNRRLLVKLLDPLGFGIREAENGQQAVGIWDTWEPHLIWMDMRMPVMDGYEAARQIKSTTKGQATAVIALTASTFEDERSVVLSAGCDDFLRKPFREAELFDMMNKHLGVCYIYQEDEILPDSGQTKKDHRNALTPEALAALPPAIVKELENAAIRGNINSMYAVIGQIRAVNVPLAETLSKLADKFEYAEILRLIRT